MTGSTVILFLLIFQLNPHVLIKVKIKKKPKQLRI